MSILSIGAGSIFPKAIRIGYEGENVVTQIDFNLKTWIAEYGLGGVTLLVRRNCFVVNHADRYRKSRQRGNPVKVCGRRENQKIPYLYNDMF